MSIEVWNVRGLCDGKKRSEIKKIIREQKLEPFGLMGNKSKKNKLCTFN